MAGPPHSADLDPARLEHLLGHGLDHGRADVLGRQQLADLSVRGGDAIRMTDSNMLAGCMSEPAGADFAPISRSFQRLRQIETGVVR
jgi:hypothetical protein